ncbi:histidine kinase N-terminal domain-containing protein [Alkalihalobacillus sp. BA299]|uniref:histidine kinase N-terminal domain-containing protein n=1 Tax=Alkalihalobacillus sp. BA299 TaxID=2815938 RepID=UPI001ADAE983|nr:histidine kinase N-terminal domain-containing protein [Alkalihalobacillus sp. BA299]
MKNNTIEELCCLYTNLSEEDVEILKGVAANLPLIADLNKANIFVDCLTKEGNHAIVVAEASPTTTKSVYTKPIVGKFAYEAFEPSVLSSLRTGKPKFQNRALTQEGKTVTQSVVPIKGGNNQVIATLIMEKDVTEQIKNQRKMEMLSETTETLTEILIGITESQPIIPEMLDESLFLIDYEGKILYCNPSATSLVQESYEGSHWADKLLVELFPGVKEILEDPEELLIQEIIIINKVFQVKKIKLGHKENENVFFIILKNITELREKERDLVVKSVAIREIHHRVKNNLQTVASLLRLQMRNGLPEDSKGHFEESLNRITSIASVYEIILSNSSVDDVNLYQLIEKIGNSLVIESGSEQKIDISYSGADFEIKSNKAVTVALIVNELIQNCLKHAFKRRRRGEIKVLLHRKVNQIEVQVIDNGEGYIPTSKPSLGLDIVKMLIEHDLSGKLKIENGFDGTVVVVTFPIAEERIQV